MVGSRIALARRFIGLAAAGAALMGCYALEPTSGVAPELGSPIALDLNDAGRVAMGGPLGPEIAQVEGRLTERDSAGYLVSVSVVRMLRGGEQPWKGEPIHIRSEYVSRVYERRFSRGRTLAAGAVGTGAVVYLVTRAILGSLTGDEGTLAADTAESVRRRPRPIPSP